MPELPHHLIEQIKLGNVVLFLGAGASYGAKNGKSETIPNGQQLSDRIALNFLGKDYEDQNLQYVSELAISESSLFDVQKFVADIFTEYEPQDYHLKIPSFKWKAIFTTNYDRIIEKAYQKDRSALQQLVPVIKNTPRSQIFYKDGVVPYYKLHGCITDINDPEAPLILTTDDFINHASKRERLFTELKELSSEYPILFIGFGMADYDIRGVLNMLTTNLAVRVRSYMVGPHITLLDQKLWENKKISTLKMPFAQFIGEINTLIDKNMRVLSSILPQTELPIYRKFAVSVDSLKPSENFVSFIQNDIDFIHANMSSANTDPKQFYRGYFENWDPIIKNLDVNRKIKDGILFEVFLDDHDHQSENQYFYLVLGNAGSGKSVLIKRIAYEAGNSLDRFCIFLNKDSKIRPDQIIELYAYVKERIYLFIDDVSLLESEIVYLLNKCKKEKVRLTIIGAERMNIWNTECEHLQKYLTEKYHTKYLHQSEIEDLLILLEKHRSLGKLESMTQNERVKSFSERAGKELLVALYEATNAKTFEEIIFDEYQSIQNKKAQSLYLTVSIFHRLGAEARAGFISRVHNISFSDFKEELFKPLDFIVFDKRNKQINDYVYITRNRLIAEIIFERVLTSAQDRFDEYFRILQNLNIDYESDRVAFMSITNARKLLNVFPDPQMIRKLYTEAGNQSKNDPKLLQQQAIFEMNSSGGSLIVAERYLKEARNLLPNDPIISHSLAEMILRKAERASSNVEFYSYIDECLNITNNIISKYPNLSHAYHTSLKASILKLQHVLESDDIPAIERNIKDIEKGFTLANQFFPEEQFILELESTFNQIIDRKSNAKDILERAFNSNKGSPFIALRLAKFYESEENNDLALTVVKECLSQNSGDRELNFRLGILMGKHENPDMEQIKYYLRRSFTMGDSRYHAQLWYARACYLTNDFTASKEIFSFLAKANLAPDQKNKPFGILKSQGKYMIFEGAISKVEVSYGFIKRDAYGDEIFFYRTEEDENWDSLRRGTRISFSIGFTYRGTVALNIKEIK